MWSTTLEACWSRYYKNNLKRLPSKNANVKRYLTLLETILDDQRKPYHSPKSTQQPSDKHALWKADLFYTLISGQYITLY